jgi:hypothetical protein
LCDGILGYFRKYEDMSITMHHLFSLIILGYTAIAGKNGYLMVSFLFMGEVTNPFLTISELLEFQGAKPIYTTLFQAIFLISFIVIRSTFATWLLHETQVHPDVSFIFKLLPTLVIFQSYEWIFMMLNKVGKILNDVRERNCKLTLRCSRKINLRKLITTFSNF